MALRFEIKAAREKNLWSLITNFKNVGHSFVGCVGTQRADREDNPNARQCLTITTCLYSGIQTDL